MSVIERIHEKHVFGRRIRVLSQAIAEVIPVDASVLDVGSGDGRVARLIHDRRPDTRFTCLEVLVRGETLMPVQEFNGRELPFPDASFDTVLFVDVLHHTDDPMVLLREAARVSRRAIVIKDHNRNGLLAGPTLRFMDHVGNARHGVRLPYNYWSRERWDQAFAELGWQPEVYRTRLGLYPAPASWLFGRSLHFLTSLVRRV